MSRVKPGPSNMCELFLYDAMFDKLNPIDGKVTDTDNLKKKLISI